MKIIFLNRFYWPDEQATAQLLTDLAEALAHAGHQVTVIASRLPRQTQAMVDRQVPLPTAGNADPLLHNGVRIHRVYGMRSSAGSLLAKAVDQISYHVFALIRLFHIAARGDVVVAMTDPPLLGIGAWMIARLRGARIVHWVQDIYPEIAMKLTGHPWLGVLCPPRNLAWRRADACVTLGSDMASILRAAGVGENALYVIPNPPPAGLTVQSDSRQSALRSEWGLGGRFVIAYSGNLGRVHELDSIISVAERLRDEGDIVFLVIGDGPQRDALVRAARERSLSNIQFRPPQPREWLNEALGLADLHLVTLRPGCELYVHPSKFHGIVAVGRPVAFIGPKECEIARTIRVHRLGGAFAPDDAAEIAQFTRTLARDPDAIAALSMAVRNYAAEHAGRDRALRAWDGVFARLQAGYEGRSSAVKSQ